MGIGTEKEMVCGFRGTELSQSAAIPLSIGPDNAEYTPL